MLSSFGAKMINLAYTLEDYLRARREGNTHKALAIARANTAERVYFTKARKTDKNPLQDWL